MELAITVILIAFQIYLPAANIQANFYLAALLSGVILFLVVHIIWVSLRFRVPLKLLSCTAAGIGGIFLTASPLIRQWHREHLGIEITPTGVVFSTYGDLHHFRVNNIGDRDMFSSIIIFRIETPGHASQEFDMQLPQSSLRVLEQQSSESDVTFSDVTGLYGPADSHGNPFVALLFYRLAPSDSREITLKLIDPNEAIKSKGKSLPDYVPLHENRLDVKVSAEALSSSPNAMPIQKKLQVVMIPAVITERLVVDYQNVCLKAFSGESDPRCKLAKLDGQVTLEPGNYYIGEKSFDTAKETK